MSSEAPLRASANRVTALVVGGAFVALGIVGFTVTLAVPTTDPTGVLLLGIVSLNSLQNLIHIGVGAILVIAAVMGRTQARLTTRVLGTALLALGIAGLFLSSTENNIIAVNAAANLVHFAAAATLLAVGLGTDRVPAR
jgi:hypothetical protein